MARPRTIRGHPGIGPKVTGEALVAKDDFSARYDLDRVKGVFSRPAHALCGESYVGRVLVLNTAKGGVATAWMLREMSGRGMGPAALLLNLANPIMAQGAAFADLPFMDRFECDITDAIATGDRVTVDPAEGLLTVEPANGISNGGMTERGGWYETHAAEAAARYESVAAEQINAWLLDLLPKRRAVVLDVGAGSGRDTAWLTSLGHEVIATDPSSAMRAQARRWHPDLGVQYLPDRLPDLTKTFRTGISFDFILVNAVWMHVVPAVRKRAFRKLVTLLKPGGVIAFTLRNPVEASRDMHPVSGVEVEELARQHGAFVERRSDGADFLGRSPIRWEQIAVRVPDDGTGALPLLRHIILNDDKSSTYKLALLRVICRIADGAAGWAVDESGGDADRVNLPLGLVALYWLRLFKPLLAAGRDLPQMPGNVGLKGLGFVREGGFPNIMDMPDIELRAGMQIARSRRLALHRALRDARNTIANMPARFLTLRDGSPVFPVESRRPGRATGGGRLDAPYLWSFGSFSVPRHLWRAFQRYNVWIEPALVAEWIRMMNDYARKQGRKLDEAAVTRAMTWSEPGRAVDVSRGRAIHLLEQGSPLHCVWSGTRLTRANLDIDHCFPWSAWPCGDLWNLLPASRNVNQHQKRGKLPADLVLRQAKELLIEWWESGYVRTGNRPITEQFALEASATLPTLDLPTSALEDVLAGARLHHLLEDVFSAVSLQRIRLSNDQQIPEWEGPAARRRPSASRPAGTVIWKS